MCAKKSKKPNGLGIRRNGAKYIFSWNCGDDNYNDGQEVQVRKYKASQAKKPPAWTKISNVKATARTTSKTYDLSKAYKYVEFRVRGNRNKKKKDKYGMSDWAPKKFTLTVPQKPSVSVRHDTSLPDQTEFEWSVRNGDSKDNNAAFYCVKYRHRLKNNTTGKVVEPWSSWTTSTKWEHSKIIQEDGSVSTSSDSYTRFFEIYSQGPAGKSVSVTKYYTYAPPNTPSIVQVSSTKNANGTITLIVLWDSNATNKKGDRPVDSMELQYCICVPAEQLSLPSGADWKPFSSYMPIIDKDKTTKIERNGGRAVLTEPVANNEVIFVRVVSYRNNLPEPSSPVLVKDAIGKLEPPVITSFEMDETTHKFTIEVDNRAEEIPDSCIVVSYRPSSTNESVDLGVIPHGESTGVFQIPNWSSSESYIYEVYAAVISKSEDNYSWDEFETEDFINNRQPLSNAAKSIVSVVATKDFGEIELSNTDYTFNRSTNEIGVTSSGSSTLTNLLSQGYETVIVKYLQTSSVIGDKLMVSDIVSSGNNIPKAPTNVVAENAGDGNILVTWDWPWETAQYAELSWADDINAWESTSEPSSYKLPTMRPNRWYISGLTTGITWYVRVRLYHTNGDTVLYGNWCDAVPVELSSAPKTPTLILSSNTITQNGTVRATWAYTSTDGTAQRHAGIRVVTTENGETIYSDEIFSIDTTQQHIDITGAALMSEDIGWSVGDSKDLVLNVVSGSGIENTGYSDPVNLTLVSPPTVAISIPDDSTCFSTESIVIDDDTEETEDRLSLIQMPIVFSTTSSEADSDVNIIIERAASYHVDRPDDTEFDGYEGELIASSVADDDGTVTIDMGDVTGYLDDNAQYKIIATVTDSHGQTATDEKIFEVHWSIKALVPEATVTIDNTYDQYVAKITLGTPTGAQETDTCDIYRLSADNPELIVKDGTLGTTYVDPYPTLGVNGGHRIVYKTATGDYMTSDRTMAWLSLDSDDDDIVDYFAVIIDYVQGEIILRYDINLDNNWSKDFVETKYLGGSIKGDWNQAVSRSLSVNTRSIVSEDAEVIRQMRRLAAFPGRCRIRTPEGSNFQADIQISEKREERMINKLAEFSLNISRVDNSENLDGMTEEEWINMQNGE